MQGEAEQKLHLMLREYLCSKGKACRFFHAESPTRIAFTANSTESLNIALKGLFQPGDHVITTVLEHNSVLVSGTGSRAYDSKL